MACTLRKQLFNWKRTALTACAALLPLAASAQGQGLHVFACEPEWAALVKALAPQAQVTSATRKMVPDAACLSSDQGVLTNRAPSKMAIQTPSAGKSRT